MNVIKNRSIMLGLALLGTIAIVGFNSPASARPGDNQDIKRAKTEVKMARKELRDERYEARRPVVRRYNRNSIYTRTGVVSNDTPGNDFNLRLNNGQILHVYAQRGEPSAFGVGDLVRVTGTISGGLFHARTVTIVRNR